MGSLFSIFTGWGWPRAITHLRLFHARAAGSWLRAIERFGPALDRKSTRLNSSHANISYAVFCLKKKKKQSIDYECQRMQNCKRRYTVRYKRTVGTGIHNGMKHSTP